MVDKQSGSVYSFVEKAYLKLQADDVLSHCMEDGSTEPIHEMIQEMVLAGPQSLDALREILGEANSRKTQVHDDLNQMTNQFINVLKSYGINLEDRGNNQAIRLLTDNQIMDLMNSQGITDGEKQTACLQVLHDSQELFRNLNVKISLLEEIETYLQDWLWGLTYLSMRQGLDDDESTKSEDAQH